MVMKLADVTDETGVAAFTALPRTKWAEIRERMKQSQVNKNSLRLIDSSAVILVLEDKSIDKNVSYSREKLYKNDTKIVLKF